MDHDQFNGRLQKYIGLGEDRVITAPDRVTPEGIRQITNAVGDRNPVYRDAVFAQQSVHRQLVAPPSSVLWWHRALFEPVASQDSVGADGTAHFRLDANPVRQQGLKETELGVLADVMQLLAEAGYSSLAVTGSETTVHRYPRVGDQLSCRGPRIESIVGPKKTALGMGYFTTSRYRLVDVRGEEVATWTTSRIHFAPATT